METGAAFGPWLLDKQLGAGGMGEVWLATHRVLGTQIAVKILAPELTRDPRFRERFISEAKVQARLSHPHIAHIQDFLEEGGRFAILMELIPGGTVADAIDRARGPLPMEQTLKWAKQALEALDFAHRHGVIHRDVKPPNLMLDGNGNIKVTDFGIAIALGAGRMTTTGKSVGTPLYMSPEQIMRPQSVDHRTDVYSMGVVLYEMLAGRVPFDADSDYALQRLHIGASPPPLRNLNPLVPGWLESIVLQCLAKSPDDRFAGCASTAAALNERASPAGAQMAGRGGTAAEPGKRAVEKPTGEPPPLRSQPAPAGLGKRTIGLSAILIAAIALTWILWPSGQKSEGNPPAAPVVPPPTVGAGATKVNPKDGLTYAADPRRYPYGFPQDIWDLYIGGDSVSIPEVANAIRNHMPSDDPQRKLSDIDLFRSLNQEINNNGAGEPIPKSVKNFLFSRDVSHTATPTTPEKKPSGIRFQRHTKEESRTGIQESAK
jgi:serine/threonine-protein kinase